MAADPKHLITIWVESDIYFKLNELKDNLTWKQYLLKLANLEHMVKSKKKDKIKYAEVETVCEPEAAPILVHPSTEQQTKIEEAKPVEDVNVMDGFLTK